MSDQMMDGVAIIGMAGRYPGAANLEEFWTNLLAGRDTITQFGGEGEGYVGARGVLADVGMFDAEYFGIPPREAERMDPQHRIFLEACVHALEDGGYGAAADTVEIGLFAGCSLNTYLLHNLAGVAGELAENYQVGEFAIALGNDKDFLTTRAAYKLNLRGPVVSVQSACATGLVAVCQAAQALMNYTCDMALAGGVSATFPQERGHVYQEGGIVSRDGHCRPFDADATGTVFGHGVGVVLLKRLEDAVRDGDSITAVIRGFAVNNDGSAKAGYMAPGVDGQARVIAAAQAMAGVAPATISYVEAHGTGTPMGDPIEMAALTKVFGQSATAWCQVGTAKGNIGHLDSAAGVTGVIKTALQMRHQSVPGLMHFQQVNNNIAMEASPFFFSAENRDWTSPGPRRAGVSAFGVGGVNAHVVMEEGPALVSDIDSRRRQVLCISGRTEAAALRSAETLARWLDTSAEANLADVAFTLGVGRRPLKYRVAVAGESRADLTAKLRSSRANESTTTAVAYLLGGQGTQFAGMGRELYEAEPTYRQVVDDCAEEARDWLGCDLREVMWGDEEQLGRTEFAQPAIFITELALAALWQSWGVHAVAMAGHSLGDYVVATLAGVWTRSEGLRLVCERGKLMGSMEPGAMLSVALGDVSPYISDGLSVAAWNGPRTSVLSGSFAAITAAEARLTADGVAVRRLRTSHAFHSAMMQPMVATFEALLAGMMLRAPNQRFVSSVTGEWILSEEATSASYWAQQCVTPVKFGAAVGTLLQEKLILLEIGPRETLASLAMQNGAKGAIASFARNSNDLADAAGELWKHGVSLDWSSFYVTERRGRISLPGYPFERSLHWIEAPVAAKRVAEDEVVMNATLPVDDAVITATELSRHLRLREVVADVLTDLSGIQTTPDEAEHEFLELGFDSLFLTQATQALSKKFGIKLTFRQMMEQFSSIARLADHLDAVLPADAFQVAPTVVVDALARKAVPVADGSVEQLLANQLAAMQQLFAEQVAMLKSVAAGGSISKDVVVAAPKARAGAPVPATLSGEAGEVRMVRPAAGKATQEMTSAQNEYVRELVAKYEAMTPGSKRGTANARGHLADPRAVAGFRAQWKEMVYPLLVERARGSRLWDVDGNEYIDIVNGYGCILFGHSPDFVVEAAREQLSRGVAIGPQTPLAAEVAELICELTGNERVTFCNTGSEAVMAAIRVARTVTGRDKFVYFGGDYHGTFDEVLVRQTPRGSAPVAPGIPLENTTNVVVLEYGADSSLAYLREHAEEIAAVLIEPVQTRHPELQPFEFIREARRITEQSGAAFILDEVVTGFRLGQGGVQEMLGIRADLCTYGKVIGGGHPIGVLSGKAMYLDALDGGAWQYGDDSGPEVGVTFFAGTFVRHPLAMAAAKAVLLHLKASGGELQRTLNSKTTALAEELDRFFVERGVPSRIHHFCSWFYFTFQTDAKLGSLLYYAMRAKGIHIQEGYPCFLTTAHTDADLAAIEKAFKDTIIEMQTAGVLPCLIAGKLPERMHASALAEAPIQVPLTEPQREIFLAAALNDDANCAFNESLTLELRGSVRTEDLAKALQAVLARHDALRSTVSPDGEQLIFRSAVPEITVRDLVGMDEISAGAALVAAIEDEAGRPFDLFHGPLVRVVLFRLHPDHVVVLLSAHHLVLDGWSANILLEEIGQTYSRRAGAAPLLPFSSYARIQAERQEAGDFTESEDYWVNKFQGRSPRLDLPLDTPRTAVKSYRGGTLKGSFEFELYADLKRASTKAGCTLYVTLLSGFQMLLHRLTGQREVVVGISTAGQALYQKASLVGHAVHFLPMLSELQEGESAREHLKATRTALLDAYDHQEFTFGSMLRKLKLEREPGRLPLIEVQFNLEKVAANIDFSGLTAKVEPNAKRFVNTDLFLNVMETATGLEFTCDYNTDLLEVTTIDRWMRHWQELLRSVCADSSTRVEELAVMSQADRSQVLDAWNETAVDFGSFESVLQTIERQDGRRIAVECGAAIWSYGELLSYARRLASLLLREGLEPGDLVAIAVRRSPEMVGAVLAVMFAGGVFVPLDPRHPQERLENVLADADVSLLLTMEELGLRTKARTIRLDTTPGAEDTALPGVRGPDALAYVIYTSGSTGKPKGVAVAHGALVNLLRSMTSVPGLTASDTLVAITTLAFDIAGLELLLPLMNGARLVVATDSEVVDGRLLLDRMEAVHATILQATPGAWRLLLDAGWTGRQPLKALCGGEALPRELADKLLACTTELWNVYGPTETTIWSAASRVQHGTGPLRIGPPIANTQFYILDGRRQAVPIGVTGELFIGGAGLAREYWKRPDLTAEKFLANPFAPGRMYATGDLGRQHADGTIEMLGRSDFQVKIRGYRIELAEIEATLMQLEPVKEAVVVQQGSRLVGYVATGFRGDGPRDAALLAELPVHLGRALPDYMVPAQFVILEALPRTTNLKVDRKALPPVGEAKKTERVFEAAITPTENTLAAIWAEVLELPQISVTDSIFELGAESLGIFRIAARAQREGLMVTATQIFQHRTVRALCESLQRAESQPAKVTSRITATSRESYRLPKTRADA